MFLCYDASSSSQQPDEPSQSVASTTRQEPAIRRNKRSHQDLKGEYGEEESNTVTTTDNESEGNPISLDENNSSFLFAGNETPDCLKREFSNLSLATRERVSRDMYGLEENNEYQAQDFEALEHQIQGIADKPAYDMALRMSPDYVQDRNFRLMFLRACAGDVKKAAKRITRHFTTKLNLFGLDKLVKDIEVSDMDEDDREALDSGGFQVLKDRDLAGRSVLFGRYTTMRYKRPENMLRALWYIWTSILEDEVNQVKGVVAVGYELFRVPLERFDVNDESQFELGADHSEGGFDRNLAREIIRIPLSVPARPVGYHLCTDSHQWVGFLEMIMATLCKFIRLRMKIHHGSEQECKYGLITHGIPVSCIPVESTGSMDPTNHMQWIQERQELEEKRRVMATC